MDPKLRQVILKKHVGHMSQNNIGMFYALATRVKHGGIVLVVT